MAKIRVQYKVRWVSDLVSNRDNDEFYVRMYPIVQQVRKEGVYDEVIDEIKNELQKAIQEGIK